MRSGCLPVLCLMGLLVTLAPNLVYDGALCESLRDLLLERRNNYGA
jgi:hypothetical protein